MSVRHSLNARTQIEALAIFVHLSVYMDSSVCLYVQTDDGLSALFTFHDLANGFEVLGSYVPRYAILREKGKFVNKQIGLYTC